MSGPKTNERPVARPNGVRAEFTDHVGTRAVLRHARMSVFKVREVLDLIRGHDITTASDILRFCERDAATVVAKLLASAVANAEHNDNVPSEELYVSACFADGGSSLRRFRPRARGRAGRIHKKTCHITIIVTRLPEGELEVRQAQVVESRARRTAGQRRRDRREEAAAAAAETAEATESEASDTLDEESDAEVSEMTEDAAADAETSDDETTDSESGEVTDEADGDSEGQNNSEESA